MNTSFYPIEMSTMGSPRNHDNESYDWACECIPPAWTALSDFKGW
jgi:hypothetical protein